MKNKALWLVGLIGVLAITYGIFMYSRNNARDSVIAGLEGQLYYIQRLEGVRTLFTSDASLINEKVLYSHVGKGTTSAGELNDNIVSYYYDAEKDSVEFIAMHEGEWSLFAFRAGDDEATLIESSNHLLPQSEYLRTSFNGTTVSQERGSLYLSSNGEETCIKRFVGIYDEKFTGYRPIGFSPDGKYLVYHSMGHMTFVGTILEELVFDTHGKTYIMSLETGKSAPYVDSSSIQWLIDEQSN